MGTWLSKMMWALRDVIRSAFAGRWRPWEVRDVIRSDSGEPFVPLPTVPYKIKNDTFHVPTGPNLLQNGSFETGTFDPPPATETFLSGSGVVDYWLVLVNGGVARWIDAAHPMFTNAADGSRFVDLTGGKPVPDPGRAPRTLATLLGNFPAVQSGRKYEVALSVGVGPNNGFGADFGPPVSVRVGVIRQPATLSEIFVATTAPPLGTGVVWERFSFRFAIPSTYTVKAGNAFMEITGVGGSLFIGVDDVSVRMLT